MDLVGGGMALAGWFNGRVPGLRTLCMPSVDSVADAPGWWFRSRQIELALSGLAWLEWGLGQGHRNAGQGRVAPSAVGQGGPVAEAATELGLFAGRAARHSVALARAGKKRRRTPPLRVLISRALRDRGLCCCGEGVGRYGPHTAALHILPTPHVSPSPQAG